MTAPSCPPVGSAEYEARFRQVAESFHAGNVRAIYLVHGTFVGHDALGLLAEMGRVFPSASRTLRHATKRLADRYIGDAGNFTAQYAERLAAGLRVAGEPDIPVRLFHWSSENHHIGRADGAVRLIDELANLNLPRDGRILLWGHSHAGNVFALMTNLLSGNQKKVGAFFDAAQIYFRWPLVGLIDIPLWQRVARRLKEADRPLANHPLDIVTFGTPLRYGWDAEGYSRLLHFVHHRPTPGLRPEQAPFPPRWNDVAAAAAGDYVQQLGIAGTNTAPSPIAWRTWCADRRLGQLLEAEGSTSQLLEHLAAGRRVADEGTTLLVDYGEVADSLTEHHAGHALYTRERWKLFHAEQVAAQLYGQSAKPTAPTANN